MPRKLVWIENQNLQGFGCSECTWVFKILLARSLANHWMK